MKPKPYLNYAFLLLVAGGAFVATDVLLGSAYKLQDAPSESRLTNESDAPLDSVAMRSPPQRPTAPAIPGNVLTLVPRAAAPSSAQTPASFSTEPFPLVAVPVHEVIDAYRQRARAGDVRAACWLGRRLAECGVFHSSPVAVEHWTEMKLATARAANQDEARALDELRPVFLRMERCSGLTNADFRDAYPLLRQAALAGSSDALATLADSFSALGPGMPNSADFRQYSVERDATLWFGMLAGNVMSFNMLAGLSSRHGIGLQSHDARGERMSQDRIGILAEVLARLRQRVEERHSGLNLGLVRPKGDYPSDSAQTLSPEQDRRINDLVAEIFERGWSNAARLKERNKRRPMLRADEDCEDFGATFDPELSLSKAVPE